MHKKGCRGFWYNNVNHSSIYTQFAPENWKRPRLHLFWGHNAKVKHRHDGEAHLGKVPGRGCALMSSTSYGKACATCCTRIHWTSAKTWKGRALRRQMRWVHWKRPVHRPPLGLTYIGHSCFCVNALFLRILILLHLCLQVFRGQQAKGGWLSSLEAPEFVWYHCIFCKNGKLSVASWIQT